ncbi:hypothetical protein HDU97_008691 [Phlyctochytrium planicorne]|nr:hypothetical protein HDU97_008691 [Phlyctochytrium planicorne]
MAREQTEVTSAESSYRREAGFLRPSSRPIPTLLLLILATSFLSQTVLSVPRDLPLSNLVRRQPSSRSGAFQFQDDAENQELKISPLKKDKAFTLSKNPLLPTGGRTSPPWTVSKNVPPKPVPLNGVDGQGRYRDVLGRQRLFRGTNVVMKGTPWYPVIDRWDKQYSFNEEDIAFIADLNINAIRLGVMWPGVEPVRGEYNQTYLDIMKQIVSWCNDKGIYVLLEFHQGSNDSSCFRLLIVVKDSLSEKFCGEGLPLWAADSSSRLDRIGVHLPNSTVGFPRPAAPPYELDENSIPKREDCDKLAWSTYHLTYAAANAYQNLYDNINGTRDAFAAYWKRVAQEFSEWPNVLGYDLINEPFAGQVFEIPSLLVPGVADRTNIQRLNKAAGDAIREVDQKNIIMFEGVTWDNFITGFTDVPGGYGYRNLTALSFHYYKFKNGGANVSPITQCFKDRKRDAKRLGSGLLMTEFFVPWEEFYPAIELADSEGISWMTWEYKPFYPITGVGNSFFDQETGELMADSVELYSRSYVHAIQGSLIPGSFHFDKNTFELKFGFWADPAVGGPTEARIQRAIYYPHGINVTIFPPQLATWRVPNDNEHIVIIDLTDIALNGDTVQVFVTPLPAP